MWRKSIQRIWAFLGVLFLCVGITIGGQAMIFAKAQESTQSIYEYTNVMDNLKEAEIGGKAFDVNDYPYRETGEVQVIFFVEFAYARSMEKQQDYGLYVYLYNPQQKKIDVSKPYNHISFSTGGRYAKYPLQFLNYSTEQGMEGRFYKFKVSLSAEQKSDLLQSLNAEERIYQIGGVELNIQNQVQEYVCGQTYTYRGFAKGYGSELAQENSLTCVVDGYGKSLTLDVRSTYYRPKGTNGVAYARDTLHSVYFSVPNAVMDEYGEMTAVHATWKNAKTNPIFVTGNQEVYEAILPYVGKEMDGGQFTYAKDDASALRYSLIASKYIESASWNLAAHGTSYLSYNENRSYTNSDVRVSNLRYLFYAENGDADTYSLPAEALIGNKATGEKGYFERYSQQHGGALINGKYSRELFEEIASEATDITIAKNETFSLTDEVISQTLWQQFVGGGYEVSGVNTYTVSAIKRVGEQDFKNNQTETCTHLFIDESDYKEFYEYYQTAKRKSETVYLFRYYQSDYKAYEAVEYLRGEGDWTLAGTQFGYEYVDTNAYFMQTWVQLDFDVIDATFTKDSVEVILPAVMAPMDIVADSAPPVIVNGEPLEWWQILLGIVGLILVLWLLIKFVFKFLWWLIALPFKAFRGRKK